MPDNAGYMQAAYTAVALIYGGYALALLWRRRRLRARVAESEGARLSR